MPACDFFDTRQEEEEASNFSFGSSLGPLTFPTSYTRKEDECEGFQPLECSTLFEMDELSKHSEGVVSCSSRSEDDEEGRAKAEFRHRLLHGPSRADLRHDRQAIHATRQNLLNNFILKHSKAATVNRTDHHIMLRILIGTAYFADADRRAHLPQWRRIVAAVRREYWGSNAIFNLSPDPYHNVLATLSSMMLWNPEVTHWSYKYCEDEILRRQARQTAVLEKLKQDAKLFL